MFRIKQGTALAVLSISVLALAACGTQRTRDDGGTSARPPASVPPPATTPAAPTPPAAAPARRATPVPDPATEAEFTGVMACDEYLASYRDCHRVIGALRPDIIDDRLQELRATWQEMAGDPAKRETLEAQCQSLTDTMKEALDGRECTPAESEFVQPGD